MVDFEPHPSYYQNDPLFSSFYNNQYQPFPSNQSEQFVLNELHIGGSIFTETEDLVNNKIPMIDLTATSDQIKVKIEKPDNNLNVGDNYPMEDVEFSEPVFVPRVEIKKEPEPVQVTASKAYIENTYELAKRQKIKSEPYRIPIIKSDPKQKRKLNNRLSAKISRQRKKEYIKQLKRENQNLEKNYYVLELRVTALKSEQNTLEMELQAMQSIVDIMEKNPLFKPLYDKFFGIM